MAWWRVYEGAIQSGEMASVSMSESTSQQTPPGPGRILRPSADANQPGWLRWLPGLQVLRHYEFGWLRHDVLAGLALTAVGVWLVVRAPAAPPLKEIP